MSFDEFIDTYMCAYRTAILGNKELEAGKGYELRYCDKYLDSIDTKPDSDKVTVYIWDCEFYAEISKEEFMDNIEVYTMIKVNFRKPK